MPMFAGNITRKYGQKYGINVPPFSDPEIPIYSFDGDLRIFTGIAISCLGKYVLIRIELRIAINVDE